MIRDQTPDDRVRDWLEEEASGQLPDWVLTATFERTRTQRQRRAWPGWRFPTLSIPVRIFLAAAISLAAVLGIAYSGSPTPTPVPLGACPTAGPAASPATDSSAATGASPVEFLWSATGPADDPIRFARPKGFPEGGFIAIDPTCRPWVADTGHNRFAIFEPNGSFVEYWGSGGNGPGQFSFPDALGNASGNIAFAPDGSFYVLDPGNLRVQHFSQDRAFISQWGGVGYGPARYIDPIALTVDPSGSVKVLDDGRDVVETYDKDGNVLDSFPPRLAGYFSAGAMALDATGNVYVGACCAATNQVRKYDRDGTLLAKVPAVGSTGDFGQMVGIAIDTSDRLFVTRGPLESGDKVEVYEDVGTLVASFGSPGSGAGQFGYGYTYGLALDGLGNVYVTDGAGDRLQKFRLLPPLAP